MMLVQNATLIFVAGVIAGVIFLVDLNTNNSVSVACMYAVVILYSWLFPGKDASVYTAIVCSILTFMSVFLSEEVVANSSDLSNFNMVIALVVIWTCVTLVSIAKSSFASMAGINEQLSISSAELLEKVKELDVQQQLLSDHKNQLEHLNADLILKNKELERFTSIASHDLQEPLRTIGNMTVLISRKYYSHFDDQGKKILDYVTSATQRMTVLIKGLLEFSRIGNNRKIQMVDCEELVNTIALDFGSALQVGHGTIKIRQLPFVMGNPIELRMLFQNLISNALKFRKSDVAPIIEVSAQDINSHIEFCVKDNGIGIEERDYDKVFLIFQRLHLMEDFEGTGLGLAYCRKIVELHGGKIWIDSQKGVGTSFYFTLRNTI
ncbi:ATP-binding protein [Aquiflexum sp. TKW24L]|uniref:sensor histidine kinase n=1 Tax=Aquiflexum sp. TKW24L TaxID=2942212 RepID=UPI0020BD9833|nr:ATP-binding protein [Aquiflexum sp. TKW24L]